MSILSERIKKERENLGMTRDDLAKKIGVSYSAIAMYEQGNREPNRELAIKLCKTFNCSMDYLMGLTNHKFPKEELEDELYQFNLSEDELNNALNCFMHDSKQIESLAFALLLSPTPKNEKMSRERKILVTIMNYIFDFLPNDLQMTNNKENLTDIDKLEKAENEFYRKFNKALIPAKRLLVSLDKSKIIHNYQNNVNTDKQFYLCPVYGQISAGQPNWAEECIDGYLPIDPNLMNIVNPDECFFLKVNGESMNKIIRNGAYALIRKTDFVENGEIAVVLVNRI